MPGKSAGGGLIPDQLLSQIKRADSVLFLGADLPLGYRQGGAAQHLCRSKRFVDVAEFYKGRCHGALWSGRHRGTERLQAVVHASRPMEIRSRGKARPNPVASQMIYRHNFAET